MQKKKILIYSLIIVSILSIILLSKYIGKEPSSLDEVRLKDTVINKNNNLAIMLETEADSGEYEEADSIVFPKSQYKFNAELSGCLDMNGLKIDNVLTYKDGMAYVEVGSSAYCYLYFNLPPKFVNYLLNEKTRPTSLWTSTLDGDGYRFVGGNATETYCSYPSVQGDAYTVALSNANDSCPTMFENEYYDETYDSSTYEWDSECSSSAYDCYERSGIKVLPAPDNYICFGTTDKDSCVGNTDVYMYRIIGIFKDSDGNNHLKLIKKEALNTAYRWKYATDIDTNWENSDLYNGINGSYFLSNTAYPYMQNTDWTDLITDWTWSAVNTKTYSNSGPDYASLTPDKVYYHEMNHTKKSSAVGSWTTPKAMLGLKYVSDSLLTLGEVALGVTSSNALLDSGWINLEHNDSDAPSYDVDWTMSRYGANSAGLYSAWRLSASTPGFAHTGMTYPARPVFYLNTDVLYDSGSGSLTDPFIIYTEAAESALPTYTITGSSNNTSAGTVTVNTPTVEHGGTAQWTISVNSGYYYSSNSCGASKSGNTLTLTNVTSDTSCTVYFYEYSTTTYHTVTVTSENTAYGTVSPSGSYSVVSGNSKTYTLTPATGYEYKSNTCGGTVSGNKMTISNITSDKTCTVTFGRPDVTITVSSNNTSYGTVSPGSQTVPQGEAAIFTLSPATGYKYSSNTCGATVSGNTMTVHQVDSTTSCTVTFTQLSYRVTLTVVDNLGNTVDRQLTMVQHGGTATFDVSTYIDGSYLTDSVSCNNLIVDGGVSGNTLYINHVTETLNCSMRVSKAV